MKFTLKEKENLANEFNISTGTFYNWEKNKPRLIELITLGLQKEKELSLNIENVDNEVDDMKQRMLKLEEQMKLIEEKK